MPPDARATVPSLKWRRFTLLGGQCSTQGVAGGGRGALVRHDSPPLTVFAALLLTVGTLKAALTLRLLS